MRAVRKSQLCSRFHLMAAAGLAAHCCHKKIACAICAGLTRLRTSTAKKSCPSDSHLKFCVHFSIKRRFRYPWCKCESLVNAPPEYVLQFIWDISNRFEYDEYAKKERCLVVQKVAAPPVFRTDFPFYFFFFKSFTRASDRCRARRLLIQRHHSHAHVQRSRLHRVSALYTGCHHRRNFNHYGKLQAP